MKKLFVLIACGLVAAVSRDGTVVKRAMDGDHRQSTEPGDAGLRLAVGDGGACLSSTPTAFSRR